MHINVEMHQQIHVFLPISIMDWLKHEAKEQGYTPARLARRWIEERLAMTQQQAPSIEEALRESPGNNA